MYTVGSFHPSSVCTTVFTLFAFCHGSVLGTWMVLLCAGDRLWVCEASKGPDMDTVWYTRIPRARDHPQQGQFTFHCSPILWALSSGSHACHCSINMVHDAALSICFGGLF